jgi:hypothetical protein
MTNRTEIMFREAALISTALTSLTIADANAGSAVVLSSNGYNAAAWGQFLNAEATAKANTVNLQAAKKQVLKVCDDHP